MAEANARAVSAESAEEYTQALSQVFAGSYRQVLWAQQEGIPAALGLTTEQWVTERLGGYIKMQVPDRRKAVAELTKEGLSNRKQAEILGVDESTIRDDKRAGNPAPAYIEATAAAETDAVPAGNPAPGPPPPNIEAESKTKTRKQRDQKAAAKREDKQRREAAVRDVPAPDIRHGQLSKALADVGDVDLIFTDPPYPREFLPAWTELAAWAARALKPGALLLAYSGQYHLLEVMERLSAHLEYQWLGWIATTGPQVAVHQRPIMSGGKPLLIFSNGRLAEPFSKRRFFDSIDSERRTRERHTWEQAEGPAAYYIEALTERGRELLALQAAHPIVSFKVRELCPPGKVIELSPREWWEHVLLVHRTHHKVCLDAKRRGELPVHAVRLQSAQHHSPIWRVDEQAPLPGFDGSTGEAA